MNIRNFMNIYILETQTVESRLKRTCFQFQIILNSIS